ncbi:MAG: NAD(P)/FAD-dependent oxidoreductase [Gammaproteobacteria bacterium]|nr:NAD(P)/FAD-dependent oxidoreductase [Gammaproteobacteria bacterium]MCI0692262.1 NAD(P)/FAD-dependent oxidoreductase [candidate division KSB1 bacterium]
MMRQTDVVIVGAGLAGMTLALQLRRTLPTLNVTVLDRRKHPAPETTFKIGESMVEVSSWYLREELGLRNYLLESHLPKFGLRFFMTDGDNRDIGRRPEFGLLNIPDRPKLPHEAFPGLHLPTYNVDRGRLENDLVERCREAGAEVLDGCKVETLNLGNPHELETPRSKLRARWVIDATGRAGILAHQLKLRQYEGHQINAAWFRLGGRINTDQWTKNETYHNRTFPDLRWRSTNHLMGPGYWIWLIPLQNGSTSVGIVADPNRHPLDRINRFERALTWLREREPQLAEVAASLERLDFRVLKVQAYLCRRPLSVDRWALCGESGFFVDALYSPGGDFIAVGNTLTTQMIAADYAGDRLRVATLAKFGEQLLNGMLQHYIGLYHGSYQFMGKPGVMLQKVAWDIAVYFAYNVLLFCNGRLCDPEFHRTIRQENARLESLQQLMRYRFKARAAVENGSYTGRFIDQTYVEPIMSLYRSSNGRLDADALKARLGENLKILERFGNNIEELVA